MERFNVISFGVKIFLPIGGRLHTHLFAPERPVSLTFGDADMGKEQNLGNIIMRRLAAR